MTYSAIHGDPILAFIFIAVPFVILYIVAKEKKENPYF